MTTKYKIHILPTPPAQSDIDQFTAIRLLALRTDPASFGSTYEREVAFTQDQWQARLNTHDRATFVVSVDQAESPGEFVATAAILAPSEMIFDALAPLRNAYPDIETNDEIYVMVGMWTMPAHRRRGLGRGLVEKALGWIRERENARNNDEFGRGVLLALQVSDGNEAGRVLYAGVGFQATAIREDGHEWLVFRVH